ncbi:hypothetical protein BH09PAT1_BH09PAT1_1650 [soil metagenome]
MRLSEHNNFNNRVENSPLINRYIIYCRKSTESDERQIQSLPDQITTLTSFLATRGLQIIGEPLQESKTAKKPGRPMFNQLIQMIEDDTVNGIILLNPSRLSRNTVDTGRIIYLMDQGKLHEVVTPYQTFKNNPNDKFILNLLCTQAKLENDNKSVNVKESLMLKAERGVFPGKARPGYKNNHEKPQGLRDISPNPVYFSLMRKLFDLALTGTYSVEALMREAEKLGIRNLNSGRPLCKSSMHGLLRDPFYTGRFIYCGRLYQGQHKPMITDDEFNLLQDVIEGRSKGKQRKHDFALNGIIKCGGCGYCITAESHKKNYKNGTTQVFAYYRCTKKSHGYKCPQPYIPASKLEDQFVEELLNLELDKEFADLALEALQDVKEKDDTVNKNSYEALQKALEAANKRINNLVSLKISLDNSDGSLLSDQEFADRKRDLLMEKEKIMKQLSQKNPTDSEWSKIAKDSFEFGLIAKRRFEKGSSEDKKVIFKTVGSKPILLDQKLQFQLRFLFLKYKEGIKKTKEEIYPLVPKNGLLLRDELKNYVKSSVWCARLDLNQGPLQCQCNALAN